MRTLRDRVGAAAPVFGVLLVLLVAIAVVNPSFLEPASLLAYLKRAAPLAILAVGQYFVIVSGEFDLSVGSLVTVQVVVAARLIDGDESATLPVIVLLAGLGLLIGLVNGLITTRLHVPSFVTTLGMLLVLSGAVFLWTGGAPRGSLSQAFRVPGRQGIDIPGFGQVPWSALILIAVAAGAAVLMRSAWGHTLVATGDNDRAAALAGALVLEALFTLLNLLGVSGALESTVQGVIIIAAVAYAARRAGRRRRPPVLEPSPQPA